jgi:hypothetical protein
MEYKTRNSFKNVTDPSIILNQLRQLIIFVNDWSIEKHPLKCCLSKCDVEHLKDVYEIIKVNLDKIADTRELNIGELKIPLKRLLWSKNTPRIRRSYD